MSKSREIGIIMHCDISERFANTKYSVSPAPEGPILSKHSSIVSGLTSVCFATYALVVIGPIGPDAAVVSFAATGRRSRMIPLSICPPISSICGDADGALHGLRGPFILHVNDGHALSACP